MKILIVNDDFPPLAEGGSAQITMQLASGYADMGHEVEILTTNQNTNKQNVYGVKYKVTSLPISYRKSLRSYLSLWNPKASRLVSGFFKEHGQFDVTHAHNVHQFLTYHSLKIARKHSKRVVMTFHDVMSFSYGRLATKRYLEHFDRRVGIADQIKQAGVTWNPLRNFLIRRVLKNVDIKVAVSNALKNALEANDIGIDCVIHNGIDIDRLQTGPLKLRRFPEGAPVIFFGGRISRDKGLYQLLDAFRTIRRSHPTAIVLISGDKLKADKLVEEYPHKNEIREFIVLTGWLERSEFLSTMSLSDVCVTPSVCFDSFPTVNLEAMALGKPVIATHYGGSKELVIEGETGFIIDPFDTKIFADKLDILLSDADKAAAMGEAGKKRVTEDFSLGKQVEEYCQVLAN